MSEHNISKYNRIQKEILIINKTFMLKHILMLNELGLFGAEQTKERIKHYLEFDMKADYPPFNLVKNVNFRISCHWISIENRASRDKKIICRLFYKDFPGILNILNNIVKIFEETKDLYKLTINNKIIDINEKYNKLIEILFFKGGGKRFLSFKPYVLVDYNTIYPSILIECDNGVLGNITYDEFLVFKLALEEHIKNFNSFSIQLLNLAYLHNIGHPDDE